MKCEQRFNAVSVSNNGNYIAFGVTESLRILNTSTFETYCEFEVFALISSTNFNLSDTMLVGCGDNFIYIFDLKNKTLSQTFELFVFTFFAEYSPFSDTSIVICYSGMKISTLII